MIMIKLLFFFIILSFISLWEFFKFKDIKVFNDFIKNCENIHGDDFSNLYNKNLSSCILASLIAFWFILPGTIILIFNNNEKE